VIQLVTEGTFQFHHYANELAFIRDFMQNDWTISLHRTFHTDVLAMLRAINVDPLFMLQEPPCSFSPALLANALEVSFVRMEFSFFSFSFPFLM